MTYGGRVFIGGLSSNISKDDIGNEFGRFGKLRTVWVASKPPGFAFVEYDDDRNAVEAVKSLNGVSLFNENKIRVELSKKRPGQGGAPRRGGNFVRNGPSRSPNPSFRTGNSTTFKPKPRFLNSSPRISSNGSRNPDRFNSSRESGWMNDGSQRFTPRFSNSNSRFPSSRPGGSSRFGQNSGGQYSSGGGYRSSNFRNSRQMDK